MLPRLPKGFEIYFEFYANSLPSGYRSMLLFTTERNCCTRWYARQSIPGVWTNRFMDDTMLHVGMELNGVRNMSTPINHLPIQTKKWYWMNISQRINAEKIYEFQVFLDGTLVWHVLNKDAAQFENVSVFSSDPWYPAFDGLMRNVSVCYDT